jgi:ubiquinone/menaquinone biosynthesis C-methylase UbiE/pimeloyl-ACP methyl ester carboxylesterase
MLEHARRARIKLTRAMNRQIDLEVAEIESISGNSITIRTTNFEPDSRELLFLNLSSANESFFFAVPVLQRLPGFRFEVAVPEVVYRSERRSRERHPPSPDLAFVSIAFENNYAHRVAVADWSPEGAAIEVPSAFANQLAGSSELVVTADATQSTYYGRVRNTRTGGQAGWTRIGLDLSPAPSSKIASQTLSDVSLEKMTQRISESVRIAVGGAQLAFERALKKVGVSSPAPTPKVVDIQDRQGRRIRGLLNSFGPLGGSTAVVIPPAWGRTKETLMPLAATVVECFRRSRRPVSVLRFDGINKRGESYRDPSSLAFGQEQNRFTFHQGCEDIVAVIDYLHARPETRPASTVIVSFSAASIEARRAVMSDPRIKGWVCVVGSADLQSMMKSISGGIDYALGLERGVRFGIQEILGVAVDMDLAGADALEHQLAYMSDARREMARISVPITWIVGQYDAWMDAERVRDAMSRGDTSNRKIIEIPTGHMLKSSRQALGVFQLIAHEISVMTGGPPVRAAIPNIAELDRRRHSELQRLVSPEVNLKDFWSNYLLGGDKSIGFELMMLTSSYRTFMHRQIDALKLTGGENVVDLGSGTGGFPLYLREHGLAGAVRVVEIDFVRDALLRARSRVGGDPTVHWVEANMNRLNERPSLPFAAASADAVLASLFLSYVPKPREMLKEIKRVLRPGGHIVVSSLRRDADMSKLFVEGAVELRARWDSDLVKWAGGAAFEDAIRGYMNEASRLLDLEERGLFVFWDPSELQSLLDEEGFVDVRVSESFGTPAQAAIASGIRPSR